METILISGMAKDEFLSAVREIIKEEMSANNNHSHVESEFISVKEVQKLFKPSVSRVTIDSWSAKGLLNKHFIGGRVYYRKSEVLESLTTLKKYKHHNEA